MGKVLEFAFNLDVAVSGGGFKNVQLLGKEFEKLKAAGDKLSRQQNLITAFQGTSEKVTAMSARLDSLRADYRNTGVQLADARGKVKSYGEQYAAAQKRVESLSRTQPKNSTVLMFAKKRAAELQKEYQSWLQSAQKLEVQEGRLYQAIDKKDAALEAEKSRLQEMSSALKQAGADTDNLAERQAKLAQASQKVEAAQKRLASIKSQLTWDNFKADFIKSAAIVKAFQKPIQVNMNFEQAMAQVRAVKTMTDSEFTALQEQAKALGSSTQFSATQAANTQENLARAGMSTKNIMAALPAVLSMAGAEGMDLAQAGSIIAKSLGGMGLGGEYAVRLADVLAYTSASSNTNIAEIGEAFKVVAPVLSQQGATMEQIAAYIGVMANKGYTGSEAGNAIASTTMRLAGLPTKARNMLLGIGLDPRMFRTQSGGMVELPEIMKMIDSAMTAKNLGDNQRLEIISEVFGKNQGKAMSAFLAASVAGDTDTMQNGVAIDSFGKAAEMNRTRNDTLKGDLTSLSSAWEGLMIKIGEALTPINRFVTQTLTTGISKLTEFLTQHRELADWGVRIAYAFGAWRVLGTVWKYGKLLVQLPFAKLAVWSAAANAEAVAAGTNISLIHRVLGGLLHPIATLKAAFTGLWALCMAHPFVAVFAAGAALIGLIAYWDDIKAWWDSWTIADVWAMLPEKAQQALEKCKKFFTDIYDWIVEKFSKLNPFNWELPSWMGGGTIRENKQQVSNANSALQGYMPPEIKNAKGGIYSRPIWTWAAEDGPEAIIPLSDKSRGIPLVMRAAEILGITPQKSGNVAGAIQALSPAGQVINQGNILNQERQMINNVSQFSNRTYDGNNAVGSSAMTFTPTYNITVNGEGGSQGIAENIRSVIEDTMNEIMSRMERVSYA